MRSAGSSLFKRYGILIALTVLILWPEVCWSGSIVEDTIKTGPLENHRQRAPH